MSVRVLFLIVSVSAIYNDTILAFNSANGKQAVVFRWIPGAEETMIKVDTKFDQTDADATFACSLMFNGKMLLAGGYNKRRQLAMVSDSCKVAQVGQLPFDLFDGSCSTFINRGVEPKLYLCFPYSDPKTNVKSCWSYNGKTFRTEPASQNSHQGGQLQQFRDKLIGIAGRAGLTVESLSVGNTTWSIEQSLPMDTTHYENYLCDFSSVVFNGSIFIFGGDSGGWRVNVMKYDGKWTMMPSLLAQRDDHRSIVIGNSIYHVGGTNMQQPM